MHRAVISSVHPRTPISYRYLICYRVALYGSWWIGQSQSTRSPPLRRVVPRKARLAVVGAIVFRESGRREGEKCPVVAGVSFAVCRVRAVVTLKGFNVVYRPLYPG